jgi:uncharacterized protein YqeY
MELRSKIELDLKDAMRASNDIGKRTLRMVLASIKLTEVDRGVGVKLDDATIIPILQKEIKSRRESIQEAEKANRPDLVKSSQEEIAVLETYLPQGISESELRVIAAAVIAELNASSVADMGKVIKTLLSRLQGRAPGDQVSKVVREILQK